jgi:hypothetical protein
MDRFRNVSFTSESMEEFIKKYNSQAELLPLYLDRIRNGYELTEEMIKNIDGFDNTSKMKIIQEYNRCMKIFNDALK